MASTAVRKSRQHNLLSSIACVLLLLASSIGFVLWHSNDARVMTVQSDSMVPTVRKGDAIVLGTIDPAQLRVGDVVSYRSPTNQSVIITHRIITVEKNWKQLIIQGDNASRPDAPVPMSSVIGKVNVRVAYAGFGLDFLRTPLGLAMCVYLPALLIVSLELRRLAVYYSKPTYRLLAYTKH